jgi:hypothetical protein
VQVDIFYPAETEDGNMTLKRTKMYTQEEAPLHLQENSEFSETYQPKRPEGVSIEDSLQTKTVVGRDGKKRQISSLRAELQTMKK